MIEWKRLANYFIILTLPYWILVTSRNVWGRFGYLILSCCRSASALFSKISILSISDTEKSFMKDQDVRTGVDFPLLCSAILCFQASIAASNLLMVSSTLWSDFKFSKSIISLALVDSAVINLYSSSPRHSFPDCKCPVSLENPTNARQNYKGKMSVSLYLWQCILDHFWNRHF